MTTTTPLPLGTCIPGHLRSRVAHSVVLIGRLGKGKGEHAFENAGREGEDEPVSAKVML